LRWIGIGWGLEIDLMNDGIILPSVFLLQKAQQLSTLHANDKDHPELTKTMQTLRSFQTYQQLTQRQKMKTSSEFQPSLFRLTTRDARASKDQKLMTSFFPFPSHERLDWTSKRYSSSCRFLLLFEWSSSTSNHRFWPGSTGCFETSDRSLQDAGS